MRRCRLPIGLRQRTDARINFATTAQAQVQIQIQTQVFLAINSCNIGAVIVVEWCQKQQKQQ